MWSALDFDAEYGEFGDNNVFSDADPFFIEISNNEIKVSQGNHDSRLATIIAETQDLIAMLEGKLDSLGAFFSGKLKIEGKVMETQSLNFILKEAISSS